jgi:hypothetical protein
MLLLMSRRVLAVATITLVARAAGAHVAPSVDDNNRYLKLTPLGDRVRFAYTVFFGEIPGASERRNLDTNHDGQISDDESHAFATNLAAQVGNALELEIDGHAAPIRWTTLDVGMTTRDTAAGSFSVDLVAYPCLPTVRGAHTLRLRDRFVLTRPGETEVKVEDSPGVTIERARIGPADDPSYDYKFVGGGGPLADDGLDLRFTAGPRAPVTADNVCTAPAKAGGGSTLPWLLGGAGALVLAGGGAWLALRRRRQ